MTRCRICPRDVMDELIGPDGVCDFCRREHGRFVKKGKPRIEDAPIMSVFRKLRDPEWLKTRGERIAKLNRERAGKPAKPEPVQ